MLAPSEPVTRASASLTSPLRLRRVASRIESIDVNLTSEDSVHYSKGDQLDWVNFLPDAACIVDDSGVIIKHNQAFTQLKGFSSEETCTIFKMWERIEYEENFHHTINESHQIEGSFSSLIGFDVDKYSLEWWMSGYAPAKYFLLTARNLLITPLYKMYKDMEDYRQLHEEMLR